MAEREASSRDGQGTARPAPDPRDTAAAANTADTTDTARSSASSASSGSSGAPDERALRRLLAGLTAVRDGDLSVRLPEGADGVLPEIAAVYNDMVDRLSLLTSEVTRVAHEVGTEGKLGGQARVRGVSGTWKDLTDNVNSMADNLTNQVRNIAQVTTSVAQGDLTSRIDVSARGEILELKTTINTMVDQLSSFAAEVTRVAREVGTEGKLGGQAEVEGVSGTWMRLTENVNELAGNLTRQVRAIAEVTSAVAEGDLTRSITMDAPGEVGELRDNINAMVESLRATTRANEEQDWLQTNLARVTALLQGTRGVSEIAELIMTEVPPLVSAQYGAFFIVEESAYGPVLTMSASYGLPTPGPGRHARRFKIGEGLVGQAARDRRALLVDPLPEGYATISSAVGSSGPAALVVLPIVVEEQVLGAVELASLQPFGALQRDFLDRFVVSAGAVLSSLVANLRTDELLAQSRSLADELRSRTQELQARQRELQRSNAELQEQAELLADRNKDIESKNRVIEQARQELETRAQQLSRTSMYKSEFLANMSHELRTPLNSLLILARLLAQNPEGNLTAKQTDYAEVIHSAGSDLLQLINDILDLSKVEAGKLEVRREPFALTQLLEYLEAAFGPVADERGLDFTVTVAPDVPAHLTSDEARLRQVLRNLLSNALKFTERGRVSLTVEHTPPDEIPAALREAAEGEGRPVLAFRVADTGIGIPGDRLRHIFDAFHQGDGTTAREYGGTGLGLSISRELAALLGGVIEVESTPGEGSVFTFHLPERVVEGGATDSGTAEGGTEADRKTETGGTDEASTSETTTETEAGAEPETARTRAGAETTETTTAEGGRRRTVPPAAGAATVLVVDDDTRNVFALAQVLESHGLRVLTAGGGRRALDLLTGDAHVDLVLMDVMMAGMDGYRTIEEIRRLPSRAGLPVIAVTAKAMPGDRLRALESGADDYLAKPVDEDELMVKIRRRLGS